MIVMRRRILFLLFLLLLLIFSGSSCCSALDMNISEVLARYSDYSQLNTLLLQSGVAQEINQRESLTILCPDNSLWDPILGDISDSITGQELADILRYHVLLEYQDLKSLRDLQGRTKLFTTLFQTTGRAIQGSGSVNVTDNADGSVSVGWSSEPSAFDSEISFSIKDYPYNLSLVAISRIIVPYGILPPTLLPTFLAPAPPPANASSSPLSAPSSPPELRNPSPPSNSNTGSNSGSSTVSRDHAFLLVVVVFFNIALFSVPPMLLLL